MPRDRSRSASFQRGKPTRTIGRKLIIVVEGKKTEYGYFEAIRKSLRLPTMQVLVVKPPGTDPLGIILTAVDERERRRADRIWFPHDQAWAVFDGDEHIANDAESWHQALHLARSKGVNVAISNPSFELWYLLHFQDQTANISRHAVLKVLQSQLGAYDKAAVLYPAPLKEKTMAACSRAKHLDGWWQEIAATTHPNPSTGVWRLVTELLTIGN